MTKAHVLKCAAYNLGLLLRKVFGLGKPRSGPVLFTLLLRLWAALTALLPSRFRIVETSSPTAQAALPHLLQARFQPPSKTIPSLTTF